MDKIIISELEVFYRVGVTAEERARAQRLLLTIEMEHDFQAATARDALEQTIDYAAVSERLLQFGADASWALIETLAADAASMILQEFSPNRVVVEVKKFSIPQARHVGVTVVRPVRSES